MSTGQKGGEPCCGISAILYSALPFTLENKTMKRIHLSVKGLFLLLLKTQARFLTIRRKYRKFWLWNPDPLPLLGKYHCRSWQLMGTKRADTSLPHDIYPFADKDGDKYGMTSLTTIDVGLHHWPWVPQPSGFPIHPTCPGHHYSVDVTGLCLKITQTRVIQRPDWPPHHWSFPQAQHKNEALIM